MKVKVLLVALFVAIVGQINAETWSDALAKMPLGQAVGELNRTNCVRLLLDAFQSNATVRAFIFTPGATDELYFFKRVCVPLTNASPTLLDAVAALTNQSPLRAAFRPPFFLLYSNEDVLDLIITNRHEPTVEKLKQRKSILYLRFDDRDWDQVRPVIIKQLGVDLKPWPKSRDSWHFYRHSFAGWNLTPWEAAQATALAGKTLFTVSRGRLTYELDPRFGALPKLEHFPPRF